MSISDRPSGARPGILNWGCSVLVLLAGIGIFALFLLSPRSGATPEEQLTYVEGVPTKIEVTPHTNPRGGQWYCLECTVGGQTFQWLSDDPAYEAILKAAQSGRPVRAWVSPKQASTGGIVPLYKFSQGETIILDYAVGTAWHNKGQGPALVGGTIALLLGIYGIVYCVRQSAGALRSRPN